MNVEIMAIGSVVLYSVTDIRDLDYVDAKCCNRQLFAPFMITLPNGSARERHVRDTNCGADQWPGRAGRELFVAGGCYILAGPAEDICLSRKLLYFHYPAKSAVTTKPRQLIFAQSVGRRNCVRKPAHIRHCTMRS